MTEGARKFMDTLAADYVKEGYPHHNTLAFEPEDEAQERIFGELRAAGMIRGLTATMWVLTDAGLEWVLKKVPMSAEARALFDDLKQKYIAAGYPARRGWAIEPDGDSQESVYNELRARGFIETLTVAWYIFSEAAVRRMSA